MKAVISLLAATLLTACNAEPPPLVTVSEATVIALPSSAAVYFTLVNSGGRDRLLSVGAAGVGKAGLHETSMDGDIMRMRAINGGIEIPARGRVRLSANGRHVMIQDLARPLTAGSSIRLTLRFERQGEVAIDAPVSGPR
ncbi:MAG: copper chaperone PCu(A)C [Sphingomicrobium sp.]